ncbi:ras-related protein Rab-44 isoform X3 [Cervus canadensis]|uniref:ras-related protein Rab-44 isoform X3 n=1 Tax=Cervus canadensis TaxID=1574408 RepID=UPI001CA35FD6|nr:ras-related protein Rab-44 isoform X3 [Cervus canadensis]
MESGLRVTRKGRKLGSSRRRQMREPADGQDAPVAPEPESWSSQSAEELQSFFQDCGAEERGFVTREDLAAAKFSFLSSEDELEMIFDWVDVERKGRLSLEEFSSGLKNIFGSSLSSHRLHRKRPLLSKRGSVATSFPVVEEANSEEKEAFFAFMEQLGASNSLPEQAEIWQLWRTLRKEEPQLAGNLEGFLAKMNSRLQEAQADKEVLELTLRKRDTDHHREVQQLYEEMEQQIQREKQQLQAESDSRGLALSSQMQEVLEAKEREVQRLTEGQKELEAQLHRLSSTHQEASSENRQLREAERDLAGRLEEVRGQLQVTRGQLDAARGRVSWQMEEELSVPRAGEEKAPDAQAVSWEEAPLPGLFGDNDDWDQLLSGIGSTPLSALQLCWSPPPTPKASPGPPTPRVEPSSDPGGSPSSPPGAPSGTEEEEGENPDGPDMSPPEQIGQPPSLEPREESQLGPGVHIPWGLPGVPAGESGSLVAAALEVLVPLEDGAPPEVTSPPPQASAGPKAWFQTSHLETHVPLFAHEPSSDPGGSPRSPPGAPSGTKEEEGANTDGLDTSPPEQTGEPPSPEPREESGLGPGVHFPWGLPGVPAGESGSLVAAALEVLAPLEDGPPPEVTSPPPQALAGPKAWFQTSHLETHVPLFAQEPSSDPGGSPRSPPGAPSGTEEEEGANTDGLDTSPPEQTGEPPSPEPREESQLGPGVHFPWGLPGVPAGESGSLVAAALEVLAPLEDGPPPEVTSPPPQASAGPKAWFQTSHLETHVPLFAQEPSSDPGGSPRSPPGAPSGTEEEEGENPDGPDTSPPEQTGQPPSPEPREESGLGPGVHIPWGLPGVPAGESGSLVAAALEVLAPLEDGPPPEVTSPPPQASAGPKAWFQTSHLETHVPLFAQEPSSDPGGSPRSPPGAPSGTEEEEGANTDGLDTSPPEQTGEPPSPEPREESQLGPGVHFPWGLPGVPAGESGSLVAAALEVLAPLEDGPPPEVTSPPPQASAGPKAWFQTSHLEPHVPLFAQEPSSDPGGSPRSPPGAPSGTEEEEGVNPDGLDSSPPEQTGEPPSPESREQSGLGPGVHFPWGLPGVPAGESGNLVAAAVEVLVPLEDGPPPEVTSPPPQASAGPKAWFQTSHLEPLVPLFAQESSSDPGGSPRSPPGAPSGTKEEEGANTDGLDTSPPEQTGESPSPEPREESQLGPGVHIPWGLPGVPAGESGSLVAAALEVLAPLEDGPPPEVTSPPPQALAGPKAWFQTSHLETHVPLFAQEPSSDPGGSPRSPPGAPSGTEEEEGANTDGLDTSPPEQTGEPPSPEPREESQLGPGVHFPWGLPGVPAGESGSLVAAALEVLAPLEDGPPPEVTSPPPQASAGPKAWFQTSHLETHVPLFAQEPSSDPGGSPRSPPGAPSGTEEEEGENPDGPDTSPPEQTGQPPSPEPREESQLGPGVHIPWGLPGVPAGESGSLVAAALEVLAPLEDGPPPEVTSPPPQASAGPKAWFQTSHLETHLPLFAQEPSSDPGGSPRSPPRASSGTEEEEGANTDGLDTSPPEQTGEPPSPEPREESQLGPGVHIPWGLPGVPAGESGSLVAAALEVLVPLEDGAPPQVTSPPPQASAGPSAQFQTSHPDDEGPDPGPIPPKPPRQREALLWDPHSAGSEPRPGSSGAGALPVGLGEPSLGLVPGGPAPMDGWEQGKRSPDAQEGHSGELQEAHGRVPGLPAFHPWSLEEEPGAEERKAGDRGDQQFRSELTIEVCGLKPEHSELPQLDSQPTPGPPDRMQAEAEAEAPAPRKPSRGFARMGPQPGDGAGPPEPTQTLPTRAELEAQPRPRPTTTHAEGEQAPSKSREPRAENRPEDPRTDSGGPGLTPSPGDHAASEPLANPDYAFHVIFLGDANVGKTSFLHLLHQNSFATGLTATVGVDFRVKNLLVDNKRFALQLWDTAGQERYHSVTRQLLRKADGVVLMYDITSQESFVHVRYWLDCLQDAESDDVVILLLGNKTDCEEDRQVSTEAGQQLAQELGVSFGECSAALGHNILEPVVHLARSLKMQEERLKGSLVEVAPEKPPKRAGCCS